MLHDAIGPNGVEAPISVWERVCRANTEGRIRRYAPRIGFFDHCSARVDTHDVTKRSDDLGDRAHVVAGPAAHVEHVHPSVELLYRKVRSLSSLEKREPKSRYSIRLRVFVSRRC
jgi:hypothetical protein